MRARLAVASWAALGVVLASCVSLKRTPEARFFVLRSLAEPAATPSLVMWLDCDERLTRVSSPLAISSDSALPWPSNGPSPSPVSSARDGSTWR